MKIQLKTSGNFKIDVSEESPLTITVGGRTLKEGVDYFYEDDGKEWVEVVQSNGLTTIHHFNKIA